MKQFSMTAVLLLTCLFMAAQEKQWADFDRYRNANAEVLSAQKKGAKRPLAVLMGDSITDAWFRQDAGFFQSGNLVGRGISGQCSSQMLVRFQRDVVELRPKYVAILAGINDIARNAGFSDVENTFRNIVSMCQIARSNKIKVVLCTVPPAAQIGWRKQLGDISGEVKRLNDSLREYARASRFKLVDYAKVLADAEGVTRADYSKDQIHPNLDGYKAMEAALMAVLK